MARTGALYLAAYSMVLVVAALMAMAASWQLNLIWPGHQLFQALDMVLPACLTWLLLAHFVKGRSSKFTSFIGCMSVFLFAACSILVSIVTGQIHPYGPTSWYSYPVMFFAAMGYALGAIGLTAPFTLPFAIATAFIIRKILAEMMPNEETAKATPQ